MARNSTPAHKKIIKVSYKPHLYTLTHLHNNTTMVSINYEPLEHLPYFEESITPEERSQVEQLIQIELSQQYGNRDILHPHVETVLPIPQLSNRLLDTKFDEDDDMDEDEEVLGIDMLRYQDTTTNNLYTTLSYSILQQRNDALVKDKQYTASYQQHMENLLKLSNTTEASIGNKRQALEQLNGERKRMHDKQEGLNCYLKEQWKEGLRGVVDLGVEVKRLEMDL